MQADKPFDFKQLTHSKIGPVDLFSAMLPRFYGQTEVFNQMLSREEQIKAERFVTKTLSQRYIIAHGLLRYLLADALNIDAKAVKLLVSERGKPYIEDNNIHFNLSHSEDMALIGVSREAKVGVDIEYCQKQVSILEIAKRFFSATEYKKLSHLSGDELRMAFYKGWTQKEAVLKGLGHGIADHLAHCEVSILPNEPPALLAFHSDEVQTKIWQLDTWQPHPDYVAAVAHQP